MALDVVSFMSDRFSLMKNSILSPKPPIAI
jgi:hypothetical protein